MKTNLKFEGIYTYQNLHLMYWGMSGDDYLFYSYNVSTQQIYGVPGTLSESDLKKVKAFDLSRVS